MSLAFELEYAGDLYRFGRDEREGRAEGITFDTSAGGGYGRGSVTIPKPEWKNEEGLLFSPCRFYGEGNVTRYEGRVADVSQSGDHAISLDLEGWAAHLDDNQFFRALYVDRIPEHWTGLSQLYAKVLIGLAATTPEDGTIAIDSATGATRWTLQHVGNASAVSFHVGMHYYSQGLGIGSIYYEFERGANTNAFFDSKLRTDVGNLFNGAAIAATADLADSASGSGTLTANPDHMYAQIYLTLASDGGNEGQSHDMYFYNLAVFGTSGLTKQGVAPSEGYYPGDIIEHAVGQGAPMLNIGEIEAGPPVVAQAAYLEPTTVRSVLEDVGAYGTPDGEVPEWGVYDNREFFWRSPGTGGRRWRTRRDALAMPVDDGPSNANRFAQAVVKWTDGGGTTFYVGPAGSGADDEDDRLVVSDIRGNPATKALGRTLVVDAGLTYLEGAILLGQAELADVNSNTRRGSATIGGTVTDEAGVTEPASAVRAGDTLLVEDEAGVQPEEQYVNSSNYTDDNATVVAQLGTEPLKVELILARLRNKAGF